MKFHIRPQVHKITFYWIVPYILFQFVYLYINPFGHDDSVIMGISFLTIIGVILMAFMSLFKPWMLSVNVSNNIISQITEFGGEIVIDINLLDFEQSVYDDFGLELTTTEGSTLLLHSHLFKESDLLGLVDYIHLINDNGASS